MKMSSFSIRDILNLPEQRMRSLNAETEEDMQIRSHTESFDAAHSIVGSEAEVCTPAVPETPKSSMNLLLLVKF